MEKLVCLAVLMVLVLAGMVRADEFLISHWCGPSEATKEKFTQAAGAGFNVILFGGTVEQNKQALDLCKELKVKCMVIDNRVMAKRSRDRTFASNLDSVVADYGSHPALWGYFLTDEPNSSQFRQLGAVNQYLLKKDPKHIPYINLFPTYASKEQLGNPTYETHVDHYCRVVRPKLISYDHYALMEKGERPDYFENMEIVRRQGIKHKTPFNYILLSLPHGPYRDPSDADLRWQVNTALAYGARGIMYFTYETPPPDENWKWHDGIIDESGKPNRKYYEVKKINAEVKKLAPTLMRLNSVAVYHTTPLPRGTRALPENGLIRNVEGGQFVIGQFNSDKGQRYAMFVNRSLTTAANARISFSQKVRLWEVSRSTGRERGINASDDGEGSLWRVKFAPGEARLVQIDLVDNRPFLYWDDTPKFRPRVMLNPSCQFHNVGSFKKGDEQYIEGKVLYDVAIKVRDELRKNENLDVFVSRASRDQDVGLRYETELTKSLNCDILVALHSDATGTNDPGGGSWTFHTDDPKSLKLAQSVQLNLLDAIRTFHPDVKYLGVRTHWYRLWVLHEAGCPASLTEILFHTNPKEAEMMMNEEYQDRMAEAIAKGILEYFGLA